MFEKLTAIATNRKLKPTPQKSGGETSQFSRWLDRLAEQYLDISDKE